MFCICHEDLLVFWRDHHYDFPPRSVLVSTCFALSQVVAAACYRTLLTLAKNFCFCFCCKISKISIGLFSGVHKLHKQRVESSVS